ncbi:hypothetical protein KSF78_0009674 [Schistosoma japonicum]|nr:hypothetical protein KSF78_0009674 [Schistosoma japonicum]
MPCDNFRGFSAAEDSESVGMSHIMMEHELGHLIMVTNNNKLTSERHQQRWLFYSTE